MKQKLLIIVFALIVFSSPLWAIISGRSLTKTLFELHTELQSACLQREEAQQRFTDDYERQHQKMIDIITQSNELSIMLYTQEQEMTFDLAYALKKVAAEYRDFNEDRRPHDMFVSSLNIEIDRYARLIEALRRLPPMIKDLEEEIVPDSLLYHNDSLDLHISNASSSLENEVIRIASGVTNLPEQNDSSIHAAETEKSLSIVHDTLSVPFILDKEGEVYRDSCIRYASELLKMHADHRAIVIADSMYYQEAYLRVKEASDYAEKRYKGLERYVFLEGQTPFLDIMENLGYYWAKMKADLRGHYDLADLVNVSNDYAFEDSSTDSSEEEEEALFFSNLSRKGENSLLLMISIFELLLLGFSWALMFLILWLLHRRTRLRNYIPKGKLPLYSVLLGTVVYFMFFGFFWGGDEYIQLGVRHVNTFLWLLIAISGSLLLRLKTEQLGRGLLLYLPTIVVTMLIIFCRVNFIPDKLMVFLFPPVLFLIVLRQLFFCIREHGKATVIDRTLGWVSLAIYLIAFFTAFLGYTFVALLILVWWYFLLAAWLTIVCIVYLMGRFKHLWLDKRVDAKRESITYVTGEDRESLLFGTTWFYDLIRQVLVPTMVLLSLPLCVSLSLGIFDFDDLFMKFYESPFVQLYNKDGVETLRISAQSIIYLLIFFFVMRYLSRAIHAIWRHARYSSFMRKHNRTTIRVNEINLSLGNSIISALIWLTFAVVVIHVWQIPTGSLGLVAGGLSAGIGLALKDTINNFLYGIQLMGGRLRVGDWIECDGVRGKVSSINYQCVQVETIEGTEMSFLNASLFGKNFNNLTRNNSYELTKIIVGVTYGTEVQHVRDVLVKAMQKMRTKDHYGREIVDPQYGIYAVVENMSDIAVEIAVKQYVLVAERIGYVDKAKEVIYDALTAAGISIAYPQCDIHLIQEK